MHLSAHQLRNYLDGTLAPEAMLAADDHLATCEQCRQLLLNPSEASAAAITLAHALSPAVEHPSSISFTAYIDQRLTASEHTAFEAHLAACTPCQSELADLQTFARSLTKPQTNPRSWALPAYAAAAAVLLAIALKSPIPSANTVAPAFTASILDGKSQLGQDSSGNWRMVSNLSPADRAAVLKTLASAQLPLARDPLLNSAPSVLLSGSTNPTAEWQLLSPVAETTLDLNPYFSWEALPGDWSYEVEVYDASYNRVASSGSLRTNAWRTPTPLPPDNTYSWQITAIGPSGQVRKAPQAPAPEAKFRVLPATARESILAARRSGSALLLAIRYSEFGLRTLALEQITRLREQNPNQPFLNKLAQSLTLTTP